MARGINKVILVGHLGNDPETRYTQGGMAVSRISLATTTVRKDRDGNTQEKTEWHRVVFFGKLAEIVEEYLRKGSQVYVEGRISYSDHTGDDGVKRYYTDIIADEMQMLGGRGGGDNDSARNRDREDGGTRRPPARTEGRQAPPRQAPTRQAPPRQQRQQEPSEDYPDDDIPF